jgi:hypothetical protein
MEFTMKIRNRLTRFLQQLQRAVLATLLPRPWQKALQAKAHLATLSKDNPMPNKNTQSHKQNAQPVTRNDPGLTDNNTRKNAPAAAEQQDSPRTTLSLSDNPVPATPEHTTQAQPSKPAPNAQAISSPNAQAKQTPVLPNQQWQSCFEAVAGLAHRDANPPLPCQDSAIALTTPRPTVIVADGAGSAAVSEIGAQAVTSGLARLLTTLERQVEQLLDQPVIANAESEHQQDARHFSLLLVKHARGILDDLAVQHRRPQKDFRCTLLLAVQGKAHLLWLKIGDGALVTETLRQNADDPLTPQLATLGEVGKGEFANTTTFLDEHLQPEDVQSGVLDSQRITGFAAMSDGGADRLVTHDGLQVSGQISTWLNQLRHHQLKRRALRLLFSSDTFTHGTTGDDISLALCASGLRDNTVDASQDNDG